jgi:probable F420-dependent oxidoreductase
MTTHIYGRLTSDIADAAREAKEFEELGFDGVASAETAHDPFFPLLIAAEHTKRLRLKTGVAIAFARTPMTMANLAHDLNAFSKGRFTLGIGSQIKTHIERRFSMPWSHPARRMREFIEATKAIFATWYKGEKLEFKGEFYSHTLMTPFFTPTDTEHGPPPISLAAVGPLMTQAAGAVADMLSVHGFTTEAYLRNTTLPHVRTGEDSTKRPAGSCRLHLGPFIVTGTTEKAFKEARRVAADRIAFYASTPAYRGVLEAHGWGDLQPLLQGMTRQGRWAEMGAQITDEMIRAFAVVGEARDIAPEIWKRYGDIVADFGLSSTTVDRATLAEIGADLRALAAGAAPKQKAAG